MARRGARRDFAWRAYGLSRNGTWGTSRDPKRRRLPRPIRRQECRTSPLPSRRRRFGCASSHFGEPSCCRKRAGPSRLPGRELANRRKNCCRHVSRELGASTVVLEDLKTRSMTRSAKGTVEAPGTNVRAKAGLNRVVLATGWAALEPMLRYKAPRVVLVPAHHTSQTCDACGHVGADPRRSKALFRCTACGRHDHADRNAARNIRRRGLAQLHAEERFAPERTPATGETDRRRAA